MNKFVILLISVLSIFIFIPVVEADEINVLDTINVLEDVIKFDVDLDFTDENMTCATIMGPNLMKVIKFAINSLRIVGSIAAVVNGMIKLMSAVNSGNQSDLNKAIHYCIWMAVVLVIIVVLPILLRTIGNLFGFDTTCIP